MSARTRVIAIAVAAMLVVAGAICAAVVEGVVGEVLTIVLISAGLGGALLLAFLEVGLSEERELARDDERRRTRARWLHDARRRSRLGKTPRRPS